MNYLSMKKRYALQYLLPVMAILVTAASCKVGQAYKRPEVALPQEFRAVATADTSSIADVQWNQFFTDPALQALITKGIGYNYDLQIALKRVAASEQTLKQAKLLQLPQLSFSVTGQTTNPSNNSLNGLSMNTFIKKDHIEDFNAALTLTWEADIWGKIRRQQEATMAGYLQTYEASKAVQTQIVAGIAQGYYNLLMLDEQLNIAKKNLALIDSTLNFTRLQRNAGEVTTLAVQQVEAQKQSTALLIPQLEQNIAIQENALSILTGSLPGPVERSKGLFNSNVPQWLTPGIPSAVLSRRPDVRAKEMELIAANARAGIAQANMYPSLSITAQGGLNSYLANNWFNIPASLFGTLLGNVTQPIFQQRQLKTQLETAKIQREQSVLEFRQSVLNAIGEVSDALVATEKLKEQKTIATDQADTLQLAIKNARLLFKSGMANYIEVLTAQSNVLQSELNLANIHRLQLSAAVDLYRSLGGGWK
ncbi:efflux transporter outer membrane subunit [Niabella sp. CC-SYL272]|uniref:efflux transporter outer membrane subunit n=1 Tax=Niabella agricola TaxID=2891571 RepID=UPI001F18EF9B|nr:efflux transporter outer membrane subunit [Niabella agricola]MCF3112070.1 efflux transporter outer membrane subunit [Niabella agricola]